MSKSIDFSAIITIRGDTVHLDTTFNPDACCCTDDDTGTVVQREDYASCWWNEPKTNPRLVSDFFGVWGEWNGKVCGGIYLTDDFTYQEAEKLETSLPHLEPKEISTAPDGTYWVEARQDENYK